MPRPRHFLILLALLSFGFAFAEEPPSQAEKTAVNGARSDSPSTKVLTRDQLDYLWSSRPSWQAPVLNPDLQATCFKLRTYIVRREGPESDVVHPAGYTTCQPAPRFEVKVTEQRKQDKGNRESLKAPR